MLRHDAAPIVAVATAPGRGGIGVVRVSGSNLAPFVEVLFKRRLSPRYAHYLAFVDQHGVLIDKGIVIFYESPHSFTGEDVLELQGHGGTAVLQALLVNVLKQGQSIGIRLAEPGEFSLRAFLNDKIDLVQAEAISDLVNASSSEAAKAAALSLSGQFSKEIEALSIELVALRTLVEATLDFPEEEIEFIEKFQVRSRIHQILENLDHVLETSKQTSFLSDGLRVVIAGEPNVGKSSLMNAIFGENISIVSEIAGTTRDSIKENFQLDGIPITVTDTAGLREASDAIEQLGIDRSWLAIESCNVILDVVDIRKPRSVLAASTKTDVFENKIIIQVFNKIDLVKEAFHEPIGTAGVAVSALTGEGVAKLKQAILAHTGRQLGERSPWLARQRHVSALENSLYHLKNALAFSDCNDQVLDLLAEELRLSHASLGEITGQMSPDELLGEIFSSFCIGK